jgi:hypothetical protein
MDQLDLPPRQFSFDVQVEANECERQRDRFGMSIGVLRGECIDDVLMDKGWITTLERVAAQRIVALGLRGRRHGRRV